MAPVRPQAPVPQGSLWPWTETVKSRRPLSQEARQRGDGQGLGGKGSPLSGSDSLWRKGIQFHHILSILTELKSPTVVEEENEVLSWMSMPPCLECAALLVGGGPFASFKT